MRSALGLLVALAAYALIAAGHESFLLDHWAVRLDPPAPLPEVPPDV